MHSAYLVLLIACLGVTAFAVLLGHRDAWPMTLCVGAVSVNWFINTLYVIRTGDTDPELVLLATDLASLWVVLSATAGATVGVFLASSYAGQILAHVLHMGGTWAPWDYWALLTIIGYGQLALLALWAFIPAYRETGLGAR